jgi:hypothetical protein
MMMTTKTLCCGRARHAAGADSARLAQGQKTIRYRHFVAAVEQLGGRHPLKINTGRFIKSLRSTFMRDPEGRRLCTPVRLRAAGAALRLKRCTLLCSRSAALCCVAQDLICCLRSCSCSRSCSR